MSHKDVMARYVMNGTHKEWPEPAHVGTRPNRGLRKEDYFLPFFVVFVVVVVVAADSSGRL